MKKLALLLCAAAAFAVASTKASAAIVFSNLGQLLTDSVPLNDAGRYATEFKTGASLSTITGLSVAITSFDSIPHTISAFLYSDSGIGNGKPSTLLGTFSALDNSIAAGNQVTGDAARELLTFSHAGLALAANRQYWVSLALNQPGLVDFTQWDATSSNAADVGSLFTVCQAQIEMSSISGG